MSNLVRLDITVSEDMADVATMVVMKHLAYGWEEESLPTGEVMFRVHIENPTLLQDILSSVQAMLPEADVERADIPNQDWTFAWREFFTPVPVGEHFMVIAPWMKEDVELEERMAIVIEPKTAFGTGHHPTTALCLACVSELAAKNRIGEGMRFFDIGTGSGILGIGCAFLGMSGLGVDIDILAVENSEENRHINNVAEAFVIGQGSADYTEESFDLVLANILAQPLKDLAPEILKRVKQGGCLVLSGLLEHQADGVEAVYKELGLPDARRVISGEWAALIWE